MGEARAGGIWRIGPVVYDDHPAPSTYDFLCVAHHVSRHCKTWRSFVGDPPYTQ